MAIRIPVDPEGILALASTGWLPRQRCHDPPAVSEAVVDLVNEVLLGREVQI
jgi:hypothetical protein